MESQVGNLQHLQLPNKFNSALYELKQISYLTSYSYLFYYILIYLDNNESGFVSYSFDVGLGPELLSCSNFSYGPHVISYGIYNSHGTFMLGMI